MWANDRGTGHLAHFSGVTTGPAPLPVVIVGGQIKAVRHRPTRERLATWTQPAALPTA